MDERGKWTSNPILRAALPWTVLFVLVTGVFVVPFEIAVFPHALRMIRATRLMIATVIVAHVVAVFLGVFAATWLIGPTASGFKAAAARTAGVMLALTMPYFALCVLKSVNMSIVTPLEPAAISACQFYWKAQQEYIKKDWDGDGRIEYAEKVSDFSEAGMDYIRLIHPEPGQTFRNGPGRYQYKVFVNNSANENQFAVLAAPPLYNVSGIYTYCVTSDGILYRADFDDGTKEHFEKWTQFNSDVGKWEIVQDLRKTEN